MTHLSLQTLRGFQYGGQLVAEGSLLHLLLDLHALVGKLEKVKRVKGKIVPSFILSCNIQLSEC